MISILIGLASVACESFQFDSAKHCRFSLGTPVSSCLSNTVSIRDDPYWTSREQNSSELRAIQ